MCYSAPIACRKPDELEFLAPRLMAMARALGLNTTLKLYCTGGHVVLCYLLFLHVTCNRLGLV
jgi:hypothetical protein